MFSSSSTLPNAGVVAIVVEVVAIVAVDGGVSRSAAQRSPTATVGISTASRLRPVVVQDGR